MLVESNEVKGCFVPCQVTLNLLLFTVSFTIFIEIEFDFIFYVQYRSEEISPVVVVVIVVIVAIVAIVVIVVSLVSLSHKFTKYLSI